jgi:hypothetical protein
MLRKLFKFFLWLVVIVGVLIGVVFFLTSDTEKVADDFFSALKRHDFQTARSYLSSDFAAAVPKDEFPRYVRKQRLDRVVSASWPTRSIDQTTATLEGSVTLDNNETIPLRMIFVKSGEDWKIYRIEKPAAGVAMINDAKENKDIEHYTELAKRTGSLFFEAMKRKDMRVMKPLLSSVLLQQYDMSALQKAYAPIMQASLDWDAVGRLDPSVSSVRTENGKLKMTFVYPTEPPIEIDAEYVKEGGVWKVTGLFIGNER